MEIESKHFTLEKVKNGIYAAIAKDGGGAVGNAGFIDLGNKTIVFDTFNTQQAARDLKTAAELMTNRPVDWVVNSHWHGDHIRGNQEFETCNIIATQSTYSKMKENHPSRIEKQKSDIEGLQKYIHSLQEKLSMEFDPNLQNQILFLQELQHSLPRLKFVKPQFTFQNEMYFYGDERSARLFTLGGGHSVCDAVLYIPEEKVMFMGDLLFVNTHPTLFDESDPLEWIRILNSIENLDFNCAVPGHGNIGTKGDIIEVKSYLHDIVEVVNDGTPNSKDSLIPHNYRHWSSPETYKKNLHILQESIKKSHAFNS